MSSENPSSKDSRISNESFRQMLSGKSSQTHGRQKEKENSKRTGGRLRPGSGNQAAKPGDSVEGDPNEMQWLVEEKTTTGKSMTVQEKWLQKIKTEAVRTSKIPLLRMNIGDECWYVVPAEVWEGMMQDGI